MNDALCEDIRGAFAGVTLGGGIGLRQAEGIDDYKSDAECAELRTTDEKDDWSRIPVDELNRCYSSLCFFDAEGMRFHLPAFLIAELQGLFRFSTVFSLAYLNDYTIAQFALLNPKQRLVVRAFLLHATEMIEYESDRPHIIRALNDYWTGPA